MAKEPMVTRTITTTKVNVLCMNINECEPFNQELILPRTYSSDEVLIKKVRSMIETPEIKAVHIVFKEELETLYGMPEGEFVKHAKELPPRNKKEVINND